MLSQSKIIEAIAQLANSLNPTDEQLKAVLSRTYIENNWLTIENYSLALKNWQSQLSINKLEDFCSKYSYARNPQRVGIIMAGNIPMVVFMTSFVPYCLEITHILSHPQMTNMQFFFSGRIN